MHANKIGDFYKYANQKLSCKSGIGALRDSFGNLISDPVTQANCFNDFFSSVFTLDNNIMPAIIPRVPDNVSLNSINFTTPGVFKILKKLNEKSAGGPDLLPPMYFTQKHCLIHSITSIASIFELFFINSFLPKIWKLSCVKPIFKKGDSSLTSNYRPIFLTCSCCKVMESVIHDQLISYLRTHNLITNSQHGFLARKSTGTNLLNCFRDWQIAIKNKKTNWHYLSRFLKSIRFFGTQ